jgi:agmatinase
MADTPGPLALLGLCYDGGSSLHAGAAAAPARIRRALAASAGNVWSERGHNVQDLLRDTGDLTIKADANPRPRIASAVHDLLDAGHRPVLLGGDHSVTHPVLRALRSHYSTLTILHLDAHPDLYPQFDGDRHSHACPFARILEEGCADRLVQVGIRAMTPEQADPVDRFDVDVIDMRRWADGARPSLRGPTYVSLDIDVLDPAFAPGVSHPEPGGLATRDVIQILHDLSVPIVGADLVEYNPARDESGRTASVCAKLLTELAAQMMTTPAPEPSP